MTLLEQNSSGSEISGTDINIVVLEDDPDVGLLLLRGLRLVGGYTSIELYTETTGFLDKVDWRNVDVVLLDVLVPGNIQSLDILKWIATHHPNIPVIIQTAIGKELLNPLFEELATAIFTKPYNIKDLMKELSRVGRE